MARRRRGPLLAPDDTSLLVLRRDISGGMSNREYEDVIGENQATVLYNVFLDTRGQRTIRKGLTLVEDLGNDAGTGCFGYEPSNGSSELIVTHGTKLEGWLGSGTFTEHKIDFTTGLLTTLLRAGESGEGDVLLISNGTDNWFRMLTDHTFQDLGSTDATGSDSPPKSTAATYYRNILWVLKDNMLYYSTAYPADFSTAFDTRSTGNFFYIPVGTERAVLGVRDMGLIVLGQNAVYSINPSATPAATDKPEKVLDIGCMVGATAVQVADDILFLAPDGIRGVFRTQQDKLQLGQSYPLSWALKTQYENINWSQISKASAIFYDNKYLFTVATGSSTYNNEVWAYYPAFNAWVIITGWNVARFATITIGGQQRLYAIDSNDGSVYRCLFGTSDNGTAIEYQEEGRAEDFKKPLQYKYGGEYKVKVLGSNGTLTISANPDSAGYTQLGTIDLEITGVTFPTTFPVTFTNPSEKSGVFHLENVGRFKRCKFKIYCNSLDATVKIIESLAVTFLDEYEPEN